MTQEEQQADLKKRIGEAVAYCRANLKIGWQPMLSSDVSSIRATIGYVDFKEYPEVEVEPTIIEQQPVEVEVEK